MNTRDIFPKKLSRTAIVVAAVSVVVVLLFFGGRSINAQQQSGQKSEQPSGMTPTIPRKGTLTPMPNYIDLPTAPKAPTQTRTSQFGLSQFPGTQPECSSTDKACIEQRNRLKSGVSSDVDPEFVR